MDLFRGSLLKIRAVYPENLLFISETSFQSNALLSRLKICLILVISNATLYSFEIVAAQPLRNCCNFLKTKFLNYVVVKRLNEKVKASIRNKWPRKLAFGSVNRLIKVDFRFSLF